MSNWFVSTESIERELKHRDGSTARIWYREMSERDSRQKLQKMIGNSALRGDANSNRMDIGKMFAFEMERSIVDWDLTGPDGEKVEVSAMNIGNLPEYVGNQIREHLREINNVDEDGGEGENPTSEDSDEQSEESYDAPKVNADDAS